MSHSDLFRRPARGWWFEGATMLPPLLACFPPRRLLERFLLRDLNQELSGTAARSWEELLLETALSSPSLILDSLIPYTLILSSSEI